MKTIEIKVSGQGVKKTIELDAPENHAEAVEMFGAKVVFNTFLTQLKTNTANDYRRKMCGTASVTQCRELLSSLMKFKNAINVFTELQDLSEKITNAGKLHKDQRPEACKEILVSLNELESDLQNDPEA